MQGNENIAVVQSDGEESELHQQDDSAFQSIITDSPQFREQLKLQNEKLQKYVTRVKAMYKTLGTVIASLEGINQAELQLKENLLDISQHTTDPFEQNALFAFFNSAEASKCTRIEHINSLKKAIAKSEACVDQQTSSVKESARIYEKCRAAADAAITRHTSKTVQDSDALQCTMQQHRRASLHYVSALTYAQAVLGAELVMLLRSYTREDSALAGTPVTADSYSNSTTNSCGFSAETAETHFAETQVRLANAAREWDSLLNKRELKGCGAGYLIVKHKGKWKRSFFEIKDGRLCCYKSNGRDYRFAVPLALITTREEQGKKRPFCFSVITPVSKPLLLQGTSAEDVKGWEDAIGKGRAEELEKGWGSSYTNGGIQGTDNQEIHSSISAEDALKSTEFGEHNTSFNKKAEGWQELEVNKKCEQEKFDGKQETGEKSNMKKVKSGKIEEEQEKKSKDSHQKGIARKVKNFSESNIDSGTSRKGRKGKGLPVPSDNSTTNNTENDTRAFYAESPKEKKKHKGKKSTVSWDRFRLSNKDLSSPTPPSKDFASFTIELEQSAELSNATFLPPSYSGDSLKHNMTPPLSVKNDSSSGLLEHEAHSKMYAEQKKNKKDVSRRHHKGTSLSKELPYESAASPKNVFAMDWRGNVIEKKEESKEILKEKKKVKQIDPKMALLFSDGFKENSIEVTQEENPYFNGERILKIMRLKDEKNNYCADCGEKNPEWAVVNLGVLICIGCSGAHRSLGTHISKVRSLKLDKIQPETSLLLLELGNEKVNKIYEEELSPEAKRITPSSSLEERIEWVRAKYQEKRFVKKGTDLTTERFKQALQNEDCLRLLEMLAQGFRLETFFSKHLPLPRNDAVFALFRLNGADLAGQDEMGNTLLHHAAQQQRFDLVPILLKDGIDPMVKNNDGKLAENLLKGQEEKKFVHLIALFSEQSDPKISMERRTKSSAQFTKEEENVKDQLFNLIASEEKALTERKQ